MEDIKVREAGRGWRKEREEGNNIILFQLETFKNKWKEISY